MGTNLAASLEIAPPLGVPQSRALLSEAPLESRIETREVLRCPQCQLVQYRTQTGNCRRCRADIDALLAPPPPPPPLLTPLRGGGELEPGIETAEASGIPVPDVAGAIRRWRTHRGLSQRQLAERMHVPRTYVSKIENDKATPTITSLERMASAMETSIASLLAERAEPEPELMQDAFVQALVPLLAGLGPQHRLRLLQASRHLAQS